MTKPPLHVATGGVQFGNDLPITLISGPCQAEGVQHSIDIAGALAEACRKAGLGYVFKASFDKANRTSVSASGAWGWTPGSRRWPPSNLRSAAPCSRISTCPSNAPPLPQLWTFSRSPPFSAGRPTF